MKKRYLAISMAMVSGVCFSQEKKNDSLKTNNIQSVIILGKQKNPKGITHISRNHLDIIQSATLGETLSKISGIQNNYYGPNAGTPMIRSLTGNRVKILRNGVAMNDLSGISPDYNVDFDTENVESMEVYKGSSAVLFGGKAIGGAVNIHQKSIPNTLFDKKHSATLQLEGNTNDHFKQGIKIEGNLSKKISYHAGVSRSERDFVRVPHHTKSDYCRDPKIVGFDSVMRALCQMNVTSGYQTNYTIFPYLDQFVLDNINNPDYDFSEDEKYTFRPTYYDPKTFSQKDNPRNPIFVEGQDPTKDMYIPYVKSITDTHPISKGKMPNSHAKKQNIHLGIGYIGKNFRTGIAYEGDTSYYGVPGYALYGEVVHKHVGGLHFNDYTNTEILPINVNLKNHRFISETMFSFNNLPIKSLNIKYLGQLSENAELLGNKTANSFKINQHGVRVEAQQTNWKFLRGTTGLDYEYRKISGSGNHRYMPNTISNELGIFTLQKLDFNSLKLDLGYRHDEVQREVFLSKGYKTGRGLAGGKLETRNFGLNQFSASAKWNFIKQIYINGSFTHAERAPEVNELYTGNNHFALIIEENGDDTLNKEQAQTTEIGLGAEFKHFKLSASAYRTDFKNYIYLGHTGIVRNDFVVKEWRAGDTQIEGLELNAAYQFSLGKNASLEIDGFYDLVKNKNTGDSTIRRHSDGDFMPNMPTSRFGFGVSAGFQRLTANASFERYLEQKHLGKNINPELPMPAYNLLSARVSYNAEIAKTNVEFYLFGRNLLNTTARPQNSLLKFIAPLPGINIGFGVRAVL